MASLWFRGFLVPSILDGTKTFTIRRKSTRRKLTPGQEVTFSRGARPPFARAVITAVDDVDPADLPDEYRAGVRDMVGDGDLERIAFRLIEAIPEP